MSTPPRRRRPPDRPASSEGGGWLSTIAMGVGVIVAGLAIGALVGVFMQRGPAKQPLAIATLPAPVAHATARPPVALATIESTRTVAPSPASVAAPIVEPSPSIEPSPSAEPSPSIRPSPSPRPSPTPQPSPRATTGPIRVATAAPSRVALVTPAPRLSATPDVVATPAPSTTPAAETIAPAAATVAPAAPSSSAYDEHAAGIVRRYVDALIRGDQKSAYGALGGGGTLSELAFLDAGAHIVSVKVTRIDAANATVGCEIAAAKGHYYATYHVTAATSGPYISEHDYIKV